MSRDFSLETLNGGGVMEAVGFALEQVYDNITDPNCEAKKVRKVILELKFKPNEHRNMGECECVIKTQLAPQAPQVVSVLFDKNHKTGKAVAAERLPDVDNVTRLRAKEGTND
jgi:hypothetical protein